MYQGAVMRLCTQHYHLAAAGVLLLAAANLFVRLGREVVTDWDEALYAITAWELLQSGEWIATTFLGQLDYYNSKPPLNVWLIALAFDTFGAHPFSLRIVSALSAWTTVLVLMEWTRRRVDPLAALLAGLVLATMFGFVYVHSGRSGNADALFTLLVVLLVVTLCEERARPWRRVWIGPILAGLFLLKGVGVLMPMAIVGIVAAARWREQRTVRGSWLPTIAAGALFLAPCGAWAVARWSVDGSAFFEAMWRNDLFRISLEATDGHGGSPFYYLGVLQKHHYDWLVAAVIALALAPGTWPRIRTFVMRRAGHGPFVLLAWAAVCLLVPTLMRTKLPWYLNAFYPVFALGTAWILAQGLAQYGGPATLRRRVVGWAIVAAFAVAEGKLVAYSYRHRDIGQSVQGLLLEERGRIALNRVFKDQWSHADVFVLHAMTQADGALAVNVSEFLEKSQPGDFLVGEPGLEHPELSHIRSFGAHALYQRTPSPDLSARGL